MASLKGFNKGSRFEHVKAFEPVAQSAGGAASTTGWYAHVLQQYDIAVVHCGDLGLGVLTISIG